MADNPKDLSRNALDESIEKIDEMESQLNEMLDAIQKQNHNQSQLQNSLLLLQQHMNTIKSQVDLDKQKNDSLLSTMSKILEDLKVTAKPKYVSIEDIPGVRIPRWYDVNIDVYDPNTRFAGGNFSPFQQGTIGINPDGPFVVTQVTCLWQPLDIRPGQYAEPFINPSLPSSILNVPIGRYLPVSAFCLVTNNLGRTNAVGLGFNTPSLTQLNSPTLISGPLADIPEFDIEIKITGNGRLWNDTPSFGHAFYGDAGQPLYVATRGIFEKNDRITVIAKDSRVVEYYGRLKVSFHGYQILNPIIVSDYIGY
jgi:hypothetical protein